MKLHKTHLRTAPLVAAYRTLQELFAVGFISAGTSVFDLVKNEGPIPDVTFKFDIAGFGHGIATALVHEDTIQGVHIKQFTAPASNIAYSEFYEGRHGNKELITLMRPLIESKLLPVLAIAL